ncbi:MAG: hypothetical protein R2856_20415 [Caldilineaceae bacterium]
MTRANGSSPWAWAGAAHRQAPLHRRPIGDELPAVTVPVSSKIGFQRGQRLGGRVWARCLVGVDGYGLAFPRHGDRCDLGGKRPCLLGDRGATVAFWR